MKYVRTSLVILLLIASLSQWAMAAENKGSLWADTPVEKVSPWAEMEVAEAMSLKFLDAEAYVGDLTRPMTRGEFSTFSVYFVAAQYGMDVNDFYNQFCEEKDISMRYNSFPDVDGALAKWAHTLGIVAGYEDGTFRPKQNITRQEAAKMLYNTFMVYGEDKKIGIEHGFVDAVAEWAAEPVAALQTWNVMLGIEENQFDPQDYTPWSKA